MAAWACGGQSGHSTGGGGAGERAANAEQAGGLHHILLQDFWREIRQGPRQHCELLAPPWQARISPALLIGPQPCAAPPLLLLQVT